MNVAIFTDRSTRVCGCTCRASGGFFTLRVAARDHALTLRWDRALAPLYRAYAEVYAASNVPAISAAATPGNVSA
jgi:hypothetical protein